MKSIFLTVTILFFSSLLYSQDTSTGAIAGKLLDKEMNGEPLPFANIIIKGTSIGAMTDDDGLYVIENLKPGTYTVTFSFLGYETLEVPNVNVVAGKVTEINTELGASAASLDEVLISTVSRRDSQVALLLEQKGAISIKESIGAQELARMGVSDVATATTKISGVAISEASGDIFVRGLGDRYLFSTLNGLPVPSDDVERKNIDLALFSTSVIQDVSISKAYSAGNSADQASGTIDVTSRSLAGNEDFSIGIRAGLNTNAVGQFDNFKVSPNQEDVTFGFYNQSLSTESAVTSQNWDPSSNSFPLNRSYSLTAGKTFGDNLRVLLTGSHSTEFEFNKGLFREYRSNNLYDYFSDVEMFSKQNNNTALLTAEYKLNEDHSIKATSLFINKLTDEVYESGRNAQGVVFEETTSAENLNQFVRDQNIKQTRLWVNQLHGNHRLYENNDLKWGVGYNLVNADEPNRIRNEVNIDGDGFVQLARTGGFQQRKSSQKIDDSELNAFLKDQITFLKDEDRNRNIFVEVGGNYRNKERDFISRFFGVTETSFNTVNPSSIDNFSSVFTNENFDNGSLRIRRLSPDLYNANLTSYGGFANFNLGHGKWNLNVGARYQNDKINVDFDVNNYPSTLPQFATKSYSNLYPAINIKYATNDKSNLRLSASRTITLPEFKEIAPFEYVSQTGQVTRGNPDLEASRNINLDLKYELFPSAGEIVSLTGFYKKIDNPINRVQDRGSAGVFSYFNAGEEAQVYGLELETRMDIYENENPEGFDFGASLNASRMWHEQDLKDELRDGALLRTFRYNNKTSVGLQGASDWIFNGSLNVSTDSDNPFRASLVGNYASDKIFALGAPEIQTQSDVFYNDEIIEKGFVTLDLVLGKSIGDHWSFQLRGQNLLNPEMERVQNIRPSTSGIESLETVRSYSRGSVFSLGVNYSF